MRFEEYDYQNGNSIGTLTKLDFGDIIQGQHCTKPVVFRILPEDETNVSNLKFYLTDPGSWSTAQYGFYTNKTFLTLESGSEQLSSTHLVDSTGMSVGWDSTASYYVWLDQQISSDQSGNNEASFRITFDHS